LIITTVIEVVTRQVVGELIKKHHRCTKLSSILFTRSRFCSIC